MRVFLQHVGTKAFYTQRGRDRRVDKAYDFKTTCAALSYASQARLQRTEIILWFDDVRYNLSIPVSLPIRGAQAAFGAEPLHQTIAVA